MSAGTAVNAFLASPNPFFSLDYDPAFAALGDDYSDPVEAARFPKYLLRFRNDALLSEYLNLKAENVTDEHFIAAFGRFEGREPYLAMRYHGYQFGEYNPRLGDGRGFLYGQVRGPNGTLWDLATKGSGTTPYSRSGDGRLTLKGGVREILASEMLARLGVKTSRTLSLIETGEELWRGDEPSPTRSSVLVRIGRSHIRFGTFERLHYLKRPDLVQKLLNHVIETYFPHLLTSPEPYAKFYAELVQGVAQLCAQWMAAGFCHAVLNTDNMLVTAESFDYGPFAFLPVYDARFTAAYFDHWGRYSYGNQPGICRLNLELLQAPLGMVIPAEDLQAGLAGFETAYSDAYRGAMLARLGWDGPSAGLSQQLPRVDEEELVEATVMFLAHAQVPYSEFFVALRRAFAPEWRDHPRAFAGPQPFWLSLLPPGTTIAHLTPEAQAAWQQWVQTMERLLQNCSRCQLGEVANRLVQANPTVTLTRPVVEALWEPIATEDDWQPFYDWLDELWDVKATVEIQSCCL